MLADRRYLPFYCKHERHPDCIVTRVNPVTNSSPAEKESQGNAGKRTRIFQLGQAISLIGVGGTEHVVVVTVMNSINTSTLTCKRLNEKTVGLDHTGSSFPDV
ncbi:hypothetical protein V1477_020869 [Vespula maculifrons]|uniref:Uncharacterized protein n=1 Tax=Vespula maculifrons TaxID=7453 RepID=A0ABD2AN58_VESMC